MTDAAEPARYRVSYAGLVGAQLTGLATRATAAGRGERFFAAVRELNHRLQVYPQFGEPLRDLPGGRGQLWSGTVGPLVVRYILIEEKRAVVLVAPALLLPNAGF